tara:strand:- start:2841 stop:3905 length:1065 start_codon:yes stop_codon:yes gene_type:complete
MKQLSTHKGAPRGDSSKPAWFARSEEELLKLRLKDLPLSIDGSWVEDCLNRLNGELLGRNLKVRAHAWISHEWFSPDNTPGIAIPFYLAHPRLMELERKMVLDVEGGTPSECMRILRHEAGHVLQHSFGLHRRRRWQKQFGLSSTRYPEFYKPDPASKNFVQHLPRWYGQSHPDEDFAETFAVWLTPNSNWRKRYADWPAISKLEYVDELMEEIAGTKPSLTRRVTVEPLSKLTSTLEDHYKRKLDHYGSEVPTTYDRELRRIFAKDASTGDGPLAAAFIRKNRAAIRQLVSEWTSEHQLNLDAVLDEMISRCRVLKLRAVGPADQLRLKFVALLTAKTVHSFYSASRRQWYAL